MLLLLNGKVYVWLYDGASQHLSALTYYSGYLREIITGIFHGDFSFPRWDLSIGEGSDILTTLHYYCIGDPFALLSVFFPQDAMYICYELIIYIRWILSGLVFIRFIRKWDGGTLSSRISDLALASGAILYSCSAWGMMIMSRHPFFINPLIYMPLLLLGVEYIIQGKKRGMFAIAVMFSSLSNLYFFYIMAILTVVYVAVRLPLRYRRDIGQIMKHLGIIALEAVIGTLMSCAVFYPVARVFLADSRVSSDQNSGLFYPLDYYLSLPQALMSGYWSYYLFIGIGAVGIAAFYFVLSRKGKIHPKIFLAVMMVFLLFPFFGNILNGFAYASNRWAFAIPLICAVSLISCWDDMKEIRIRDIVALSVTYAVFLAGCIYMEDTKGIVMTAIGYVFIIALAVFKSKEIRERIITAGIVTSCLALIMIYHVAFLDQLTFDTWLDVYYFGNEAQYIASLEDGDGVRYSGDILTENVSPIAGVSSTQFYWSNANPYTGEFRTDIASPEYRLYYYTGYNSSNILLNLSGSKYYALSDIKRNPIPYGYTAGEHIDVGYTIMRNGIGNGPVYTYGEISSEETWKEMTPTDRMMHMTKYLTVSDITAPSDVPAVDTSISSEITDVTDGVTTIGFEGRPNSETYITFKDLHSDEIDKFIYFHAYLPETEEHYTFDYYTLSNWYNGRDEFTLNLGWHEDAITRVQVYTQDNYPYSCEFEISAIDMAEASHNLAERFMAKPANFTAEDRGTKISFGIDMDTPGYVVLATPYSEGWTAYIDGKESDIIRANIGYMAVKADQGHHDIRFCYTGDYDTGVYLSIAGIICFAAYMLCGKILNSKKKEEIK